MHAFRLRMANHSHQIIKIQARTQDFRKRKDDLEEVRMETGVARRRPVVLLRRPRRAPRQRAPRPIEGPRYPIAPRLR